MLLLVVAIFYGPSLQFLSFNDNLFFNPTVTKVTTGFYAEQKFYCTKDLVGAPSKLILFNQVQYQMNLKQYSWRHLPALLQEAFLDHQEVYYPLLPYLHRCVLPTSPIAQQVFFPATFTPPPPPPPLCIPTAVYEHSRKINITTLEKIVTAVYRYKPTPSYMPAHM